jgi:hypothetical protein
MKKCPFEPTSKREKPDAELSTNHWFLAGSTHSTPEIRENENAKKGQDMKFKL